MKSKGTFQKYHHISAQYLKCLEIFIDALNFALFVENTFFELFSEPECQWLTYNPSNSYCQLFSDCSTLDSEFCQDCITSQSACVPGPPVCWLQGECSGIVEHTEPALTSGDCLQICNSTIGCRWWTFDSTVNECVLFKSCPKVDESCRDCVSGERRCIDDVTTTTTPSSSSTPVPPKGKLLQWKPFNVITLGQQESDNNKRPPI